MCGEKDAVPSSATVVEQYLSLGHGQDNGAERAGRSRDLEDHRPVRSRRSPPTPPLDHNSITELHQAIAFYGGAYLGIQCPESAQQQFARNEPWTVDPTSQVEGGHCIVASRVHAHGPALCDLGQHRSG